MRQPASLVLLALVLGAAPALEAQGRDRGLVELPSAPMRSGLYLTVGLGDGLDQYKYQDLNQYTEWLSSPAAVLRIGGTPNKNVRIGGEIFGWWNGYYDNDLQENATQTFTAFLLDGQFYIAPRSGFYLKGGLGFGRSATSFEFDETISKTGFVFSAGAGYDIPLSRGVSLSPTVDFYQGAFNHSGVPSDSYTERVLNIGASLTFQARHRRF